MTRNAASTPKTPRKFHTRIVMGASHYGLFVTEDVQYAHPDGMQTTIRQPTLAIDLAAMSLKAQTDPDAPPFGDRERTQIAETLCLMHGIGTKREAGMLRYKGKRNPMERDKGMKGRRPAAAVEDHYFTSIQPGSEVLHKVPKTQDDILADLTAAKEYLMANDGPLGMEHHHVG